MLEGQRRAQLCLPRALRSLVELGTLAWGLEGAGVGRQWSSSQGTHALDGIRSKRDTTDALKVQCPGL